MINNTMNNQENNTNPQLTEEYGPTPEETGGFYFSSFLKITDFRLPVFDGPIFVERIRSGSFIKTITNFFVKDVALCGKVEYDGICLVRRPELVKTIIGTKREMITSVIGKRVR